eukprot:g8181.t1
MFRLCLHHQMNTYMVEKTRSQTPSLKSKTAHKRPSTPMTHVEISVAFFPTTVFPVFPGDFPLKLRKVLEWGGQRFWRIGKDYPFREWADRFSIFSITKTSLLFWTTKKTHIRLMSQTRLNESISLNRSSEDQNGFTPVDTIDEGHDETPKGLEKADSVSPTSPARPVSLNSPSQSKLDGKRSLSSSFRKQGSKKVKDDVEKQTELVKTKGTIWHAVDTLAQAYGAVGENPIHLCFLFNKPAQLELAKKILEKYPQYVDAEYEGDTYKGETYLHIAIVNKNMEMVKYLVEKCKRLLTIAAT